MGAKGAFEGRARIYLTPVSAGGRPPPPPPPVGGGGPPRPPPPPGGEVNGCASPYTTASGTRSLRQSAPASVAVSTR